MAETKDPIFIMEDKLSTGDLIIFKNGDIKKILKYKLDRDLIFFEDGTERDLRVIYDNIDHVIYSQKEQPIEKDEFEDVDEDYDFYCQPRSVSSSTVRKDILLAIDNINENSAYRPYAKTIRD